jgi:SNF2 family DNA or RNA helicase
MIINSDGKQFLISCPMWENDAIRDLPNRRWSKSKRVWTAPIIRANVEALERIIAGTEAEVTPAGDAAFKAYREQQSSAAVKGARFPSWYPFKRQPRKHQIDALNKAYGKSAFAFFMDMQTGKSKTAIDTVSALRMEGKLQAVLIITKKTLRGNWLNALNDDCPIPFSAHLPFTDKPKEFERWLTSSHDFKIMIVGWESLSVGGMAAMCERFLLCHHPTAIIGDETNYIMTHTAARAKVTEKFGRMSEYRFALTGTPAAEGPMNLFQQFEFLDPNIIGIGDYYAYRNRYAIMGGFVPKEGVMAGKPTQIVGYTNLDELMELIAPHTFQVMKDDAYDLPPKRYQTREIELTKEQRAAYNVIKKDKIIVHGDEVKVIQNTLELLLRLHQVAGGYTVKPREIHTHDAKGNPKIKTVYDSVELVVPEKNPKIIELQSIVEEARHKQMLIWAVYTPEIMAIIQQLKKMGLRIGELHGGIHERDRQPMVDEFKKGGIDIVVGNASTGGMGYSMHTAEVNVFYNNTHKIRDRLQAEDRSWGDGQTRSGIWIDLTAVKTVDVTIQKAIEQKEDLHNFIRRRIKKIHALMDGETD